MRTVEVVQRQRGPRIWGGVGFYAVEKVNYPNMRNNAYIVQPAN